jgi:CheY-like chemotaxis protein
VRGPADARVAGNRVPVRTIVIADPDEEIQRSLAPPLRARGFQVHAASDGSRALELTVLRHPDLILYDEACRLIDPPTFLQILRSNPRTDRIPVLLTGTSDAEVGGREPYLRKPCNVDELLARIDQVLRRRETGSDAADKEIAGQLSQMSVADLLQVFAMNRKSGRLLLHHAGGNAEIVMVEGRVHDARGPRVSGEKALFRYLPLREGTFEFQPGRSAIPDRIHRSIDDVLLEAMRQNDERARLAGSLPPADAHLVLGVDPQVMPDQHPVVAEVLQLAAGGTTLTELLDRGTATDADLAQAVASLLARGFLQLGDTARPLAPPALDLGDVHALRQRLLRGHALPPRELHARLLIGGPDPGALARAHQQLATLPGYVTEPVPATWGTAGTLSLGEGVRIDVLDVPTQDALRPLWRPLAQGAIALLVLDPGPAGQALAAWFGLHQSGAVIVSPVEAPVDAAAGVRELLRRAAGRSA